MTVVNTNISALIGLNNLRITNLGLQKTLERLSSGLRINVGADDPSGLAIAKGMEAQVGGLRTAVQNAEDGISLIHTADGTLSETHDILMRMRDLAVRAANEATLTTTDQEKLHNEFKSLRDELSRKAQAVTFNTKTLFTGSAGGFGSGFRLQIGPDNGANHIITVMIATMTLTGFGFGSGDGVGADSGFWVSGDDVKQNASYALSFIDFIDSAINRVSDTRASLGIQERRLLHIIDDMKAQDINISAAKSRIIDADMAVEITEFTRLQILQQSGTAILAQANAQPQSILMLLR
ncbi:MAG: flagellin [bacterium]